jgi:deoxyribodipyrimidine photo-lyase
MRSGATIVWLRQDLRLADNPALQAAARRGPVVPVYRWAPHEEGRWAPGAASRWWLHYSLAHLAERLADVDSYLVIRRGPSLAALDALVEETGASAVYWNRRYEPAAVQRDAGVKAALSKRGVVVESFNGSLLHEPWTVATRLGKPYQVFTPYWKACLAMGVDHDPHDAPQHLPPPSRWPSGVMLDDLELLPTIPWDREFYSTWQVGELAAQERLAGFVAEDLAAYHESRNQLDHRGWSRLSPHLHFGELSPRQVWAAVQAATRVDRKAKPGAEAFLAELGWREFAHHLLYHFPASQHQSLRENFRRFRWRASRQLLRRWQRGQTGYPIVDAAMRQLWATGYMPNRARMIVASFLTKDLRVRWQRGAEWFWDTLLDADLANNTLGWQWTAGCGADAAPYFRIFNPVSQAEKFDPDGNYIRRWIPELAHLPTPWIFQPWEAPHDVLAAARVILGRTYPEPVVDHAQARRAALAAYKKVRGG